jgi:hypothetical protein
VSAAGTAGSSQVAPWQPLKPWPSVLYSFALVNVLCHYLGRPSPLKGYVRSARTVN